MNRTRFAQFTWGVLAYNILVILWGAFVRASVSGDGCGPHWPLCNGEVIPAFAQAKTAIEFAHRISTGLVLPLVLLQLYWAFRLFPRARARQEGLEASGSSDLQENTVHVLPGNLNTVTPDPPVRVGAVLVVLFTIIEALIGAVLVKYKLVAHNDSIFRAVWMALHLVNTLLLLGALTLTAWWSSGKAGLRMRGQGAVGWALGLAVAAMLLLAISGAVTALGDTLFPAGSLREGIAQDFSPTAHILVRLRVLHPLIAVSVGLYVLLIAGLLNHLRPSPDVNCFAHWMVGLFAAELAIGLLNLWWLAPIPMQIVHLLFADLVWINLVLLAAAALAVDAPQVETARTTSVLPKAPAATPAEPATWRDYLALTKPRVISLLLFTTLAAMFIARDAAHPVSLGLFLAVAFGGYMAAGAANAINMVIDRDIDGRMARTTQRPTVTQKVSSRNALLFAFALAVGSFGLLWGGANLLSAMLALAGLVFYVIVYTLMLKRRTWHNIVIGGAAGAFPPLVGWAAVTNELTPLAWLLFAIIFVWTPVHFWALALLLKDDYASAGVPMLPVVHGERVTILQIGLYTILTAIVSVLPMLHHQFGPLYFGTAMFLNALLLLRYLQLYQRPARPQASRLFHYSMVYLALLFLVMAVDRAFRY